MRSVASWRSTSKRAAISDAAVGSKPARSSSSVRQRVILSRSVSVLVSSTADISSVPPGRCTGTSSGTPKRLPPLWGIPIKLWLAFCQTAPAESPRAGARPARAVSDRDDQDRLERVHLRAMRDESVEDAQRIPAGSREDDPRAVGAGPGGRPRAERDQLAAVPADPDLRLRPDERRAAVLEHADRDDPRLARLQSGLGQRAEADGR